MNKLFKIFGIVGIIILTGCATSPQQAKLDAIFYPEAPELPRLQFLTSFASSKDIEPEKSAFSRFVTGSREIIVRLDKPYGVAIHEGKIYVCDTNATVIVIDLEKKSFAPLAGAQGRGKLIQPLNISVDKEGNKYVTDAVRQMVLVYDKNDLFVRSFENPGDWRPVDAVTYEDRLFVTDSKNGDIKIFDLESGNLVKSIGKQGEKKDWLSLPTNLAFDTEGYLYVSDAGRMQVVMLDRDGNSRGAIGEAGSRRGAFARPRGVAVDRTSRIYVVDAAFDNVQMFTPDGQLLFFFGKAGKQGRGDLYLPAKVTVDYDNMAFFQKYADPSFELEALVIVTNQFGVGAVSIYGLGKEKGKKYPSDEALRKMVEEKRKQQNPKPEQQEEIPVSQKKAADL